MVVFGEEEALERSGRGHSLPKPRLGASAVGVGLLDAVQQHVHTADAAHGVVEIEAVEEVRNGSARL